MEKVENKEVANLQKRLQQKDEELFDATRFFGLCIIDTSPDLKIINIYGESDVVFLEVQGILKNNSNLTNVVQKLTGRSSFKIQDDNKPPDQENENNNEEKDNGFQIELRNFLNSPKDEKAYSMLTKNNNQYFMLKWTVKKNEGRLKHFFSRIDVNSLIDDVKEQHTKEIEDIKKQYKAVMDNTTDGIVILDEQNKIDYINETTREYLMNTNKNKLFQKMNLEGKNFNEVFIIDEPELTKKKMDINNEVFNTGKPKKYILEENDKEVQYKVIPIKVDEEVKGVGIISANRNENPFGSKVDIKKIMFTLKKYTEDNKIMEERIKELENNHNWFMKNQKNYQQTIKTLYFYLEKLPAAFSIQELPSQKYIFINSKMEELLNKKRDTVLGKTEEDIYEGKELEFMDNATAEGLLSEEEKEYEFGEANFMQKVLYQNSNPTHLIRLFK